MSAAQVDLTIVCGRDFYLSITNQTGLQNPFNLTGYICYLTVKKSINDPDSAALVSMVPWSEDLPFGKLSFKIPHTTTGGWWDYTGPGSPGPISTTCVYDVSYADTATPKNWNTILQGAVNLVEPVLQLIPGG